MTRTITQKAEPDHTLAFCQNLTAGLREHFHDHIPLEAVASWSPEQRTDVAGWLEHVTAAEGPAELPHPPDCLKQQHQLHFALTPDAAAEQAWRTLRADGATDSLLESQVAAILDGQQCDVVGTDWGPICWQISPLRKPALWFDRDTPPARGKADLSGRSLCEAVRRLYGVPLPAPPAGDRPSASGKPRNRKEKQAAPAVASDGPAGERVAVPLDQVRPSPFQPRQTFDPAELQSLADSMRQHGQLTDCKARRLPADSGSPDGAVELIGGERRWRAAELAGLPVLNCVLVQADDRQARVLALADNLDRVDLSPLERVRAYQALLDAGAYRSQAELAKAQGLSRSALSNLLRTLQLPDVFLGLIDRGTLPLTHARYLLPFVGLQRILQRVLKGMGWPEGSNPPGSVERWQAELEQIAKHETRAVTEPLTEWKRPAPSMGVTVYTTGPLLLTTGELTRDDLDVRDLPGIGRRACNAELFDELQEAAWQRRNAAGDKGIGGTTAQFRNKDGQVCGTPAEARGKQPRKKPEQRKQDPSERLRKDVAEYRKRWQLARAQVRLKEIEPVSNVKDQQHLLAAVVWSLDAVPDGLPTPLWELLPAVGLRRSRDPQKQKRELLKAGTVRLWHCLRLALVNFLEAEQMDLPECPAMISPPQADLLAELLGIDLAAEWQPERAYLELHTMEQLSELRREWKAKVVPGWMEAGTKPERIAALLKWAESRPSKQKPKCPQLLKARPQ